MDDDAFDKLVADLRGEDAPRVWSLLVTVFGDMAQDGSSVTSAVLGQITARIGIKPEAMRVALHRLRKDGWIESERRGRGSAYRLSPQGRVESVKASPRIYAREAPEGACWLVLTDPAGQGAAPEGIAWITPNVGVMAGEPQDQDVFATRIGAEADLPAWMRARLCPPELVLLTRTLGDRLDRLTRALTSADQLDPVQEAVLRVLIVHEWRRIVLKLPRLPDQVFPEGWAGALCREAVGALLDRLPQHRPRDLEAALAA